MAYIVFIQNRGFADLPRVSVNLPKSAKSVNQITIDLWPFSWLRLT